MLDVAVVVLVTRVLPVLAGAPLVAPSPFDVAVVVLVNGAVAAGAPGDSVLAGTAGTVTTEVFAGVVDLPASFTSATASTASATTAITAMTAIGALQFGGLAKRVRAAAPQRRHQSCAGSSRAPQSGQLSAGVVSGPPAAPPPPDGGRWLVGVLTCRMPVAG
jgi:hypothetical protein